MARAGNAWSDSVGGFAPLGGGGGGCGGVSHASSMPPSPGSQASRSAGMPKSPLDPEPDSPSNRKLFRAGFLAGQNGYEENASRPADRGGMRGGAAGGRPSNNNNGQGSADGRSDGRGGGVSPSPRPSSEAPGTPYYHNMGPQLRSGPRTADVGAHSASMDDSLIWAKQRATEVQKHAQLLQLHFDKTQAGLAELGKLCDTADANVSKNRQLLDDTELRLNELRRRTRQLFGEGGAGGAAIPAFPPRAAQRAPHSAAGARSPSPLEPALLSPSHSVSPGPRGVASPLRASSVRDGSPPPAASWARLPSAPGTAQSFSPAGTATLLPGSRYTGRGRGRAGRTE